MYGPLRPIRYSALVSRLEAFGVVALPVDAASDCDIFRQPLIGKGRYYAYPFEGDDQTVPEPELAALLDRFDIDHAEFIAGIPHDTP